jgi:uncharacterized protein YegJ (DUF2314 family)
MKKMSFISCMLLMPVLTTYAQQTKVENNTEYHSVELSKADRKFLALKDTAQKHLSQFIDSLIKRNPHSHCTFSVKSDFVENDVHEHMWSQIFIYKNGSFEGIFIDSPFNLKNIKTGDKVIINKAAVEDWIIEDTNTNAQIGYFSKGYLDSKN